MWYNVKLTVAHQVVTWPVFSLLSTTYPVVYPYTAPDESNSYTSISHSRKTSSLVSHLRPGVQTDLYNSTSLLWFLVCITPHLWRRCHTPHQSHHRFHNPNKYFVTGTLMQLDLTDVMPVLASALDTTPIHELQSISSRWRSWVRASRYSYNYEKNQQDATIRVNLLFLLSSTCFGRCFRP